MEEGTECTLPKTTTITGELCLKVDKNHTIEPELLAGEAIQKSSNPRLTLEGTEFSGTLAERNAKEAEGKGFLDKILFGVNEAFITAKASISLFNSVQGGENKIHLGLSLGVLLI